MRNSKFNHYFYENKLNLFKTWKGIREIINISKKEKTDITSTQIGNKTVKKSSEMNSINTCIPLPNKQNKN